MNVGQSSERHTCSWSAIREVPWSRFRWKAADVKMGSQRKSCLTSSLAARRPLTFVLWTAAALVLPALGQGGLSCHYCPLQGKREPCPNVTVRCSPQQRCLTSRGWYGRYHALTQLGCVDAARCGTQATEEYHGVNYTVSRDCCCSHNCNAKAGTAWDLQTVLERVQKILRGGPPVEADSCANSTSTQAPATPTATGG